MVMKQSKDEVFEKANIRVRAAITEAFRLVEAGESPIEVSNFVASLGEENSTHFLNGYFWCCCEAKVFKASEFNRFLLKIYNSL